MFLPLLFDTVTMQSWGYGSYKKHRTTKLFPLQSAITGMICRASDRHTSSIGKENFVNFLKEINEINFYPILFYKNNIMEDYQTIGTNYKNDTIKRADGSNCYGTVEVEKQYLENAITGCILESDTENMIRYIHKSLASPKSFIGIGRSCCIPSSPIVYHDSIKDTFFKSFLFLVNKIKDRRGDVINNESLIKIIFPSIKGYPLEDVMVGHHQFVSRLVLEVDNTLDVWTEKLKNS